MKPRTLFALALLCFPFLCGRSSFAEPSDHWHGSRRWVGPDWWANPLTDWEVVDGWAVTPAAKDRTLCLLTSELTGDGKRCLMSVQMQFRGMVQTGNHAAGFRLGRKGGINDYRHSLVHATEWIDFLLTSDGRLSCGDLVSDRRLK
ncbi:MAG: hypothetical protein AAGA03_11875, partial [Planctomycetota bacterium]